MCMSKESRSMSYGSESKLKMIGLLVLVFLALPFVLLGWVIILPVGLIVYGVRILLGDRNEEED